ncbi:hypothetical protein [Demequina aurantiaca]|uniref:hypothetical protein n=1 Tax=Demequina aurantiaca TaxID=676200 RepID=UPI000A6C83B3|nr:hypothetical protein [Demequina aurantiaca]
MPGRVSLAVTGAIGLLPHRLALFGARMLTDSRSTEEGTSAMSQLGAGSWEP